MISLTKKQVRAIRAARSAQPEEVEALCQHWTDSEQTIVCLTAVAEQNEAKLEELHDQLLAMLPHTEGHEAAVKRLREKGLWR